MKIALLASPRLRRGPDSPLLRLARDFEVFFSQHEILTTQGCCRAIYRAGIFLEHDAFKPVIVPGYRGAVVELADLVVNKSINVVIYLIDPRDPSSNYPETNALKRECVVYQTTFLSTSRSAREWALLTWGFNKAFCINNSDGESLKLFQPLSEETIALIAHDGQKPALLDFVNKHFNFLIRFADRVATGTTGTLLNGEKPLRVSEEEWSKVQSSCNDLKNKIINAKQNGDIEKNFVTPKESGPLGGDVQIAAMILRNQCQKIIFFENPLKPHEHTEDIQLLERTGRENGRWTICIHDPQTAEYMFKEWEKHEENIKDKYTLLATALDRVFNVRAILVPTMDSNDKTWEAISEAAGWYVTSQIAALAEERRRVNDVVRVTVSWGVAMREIVDGLSLRKERLARVDRDLLKRKIHMEKPVADDQLLRPTNVLVAPMQGVVMSEDSEYEANEIAHDLAKAFGGKHVPLPCAALVKKKHNSKLSAIEFNLIMDHWLKSDIVLTSAAPIREEFAGKTRAPQFLNFLKEMQSSTCGDIGYLFLNSNGEPIESEVYERIAINDSQLSEIANRRGVVLAIGSDDERVEIANAALTGGYVSVLVTDLEFARKLLIKHNEKIK